MNDSYINDMNRNSFLLILAFIYSTTSQGQKLVVSVNYAPTDTGGGNTILYRPGLTLNWSDFKGRPAEGSDAAALTNAGFGLKLAFRRVENSSQLVIDVNCNFSRKDSWVKPSYKTDYILNHEQKHFDIAYIHTCAFIRQLQNAHFTNANYTAVIEKIYKENALAMSTMQNRYDSETSHSRLPTKQAEWNDIISEQLALAVKSMKED